MTDCGAVPIMAWLSSNAGSAGCDGYLVRPFANQMELLLISSCFQELWH